MSGSNGHRHRPSNSTHRNQGPGGAVAGHGDGEPGLDPVAMVAVYVYPAGENHWWTETEVGRRSKVGIEDSDVLQMAVLQLMALIREFDTEWQLPPDLR